MTAATETILTLGGSAALEPLLAAHSAQPIDIEVESPPDWQPPSCRVTVARPAEVSGCGTYDRRQRRCLRLLPAPPGSGWQIERTDLPEQLPVTVALANIASADRAFVLRSGGACNRFRMAEHVICQRWGLGIDDLLLQSGSEDPPLFDCGSRPLAEALRQAGTAVSAVPVEYCTPDRPVAIVNPGGRGFLLWEPAPSGGKRLFLDVAIDFPTAIGRERIRFELCPQNFLFGSAARTNCSSGEWRLLRTLGRFTAQWRHTGYNAVNILVAAANRYVNAPQSVFLTPQGKALEAVWHRSCLDLVAALSLLPWRPAGRIVSYCAGHVLDCRFLTMLCRQALLRRYF